MRDLLAPGRRGEGVGVGRLGMHRLGSDQVWKGSFGRG